MKRRDDPNQTLIDWSNPASPTPASPVELPPAQKPALRLPWDFSTVYPQPTEDALDAGILDPSDAQPENVKALHEQHAADALAILRAIDQVKDARSRSTDPSTGKRPRTHAAREKLRRSLENEPERLERSFQIAMGSYANAFGEEAADAFAQFVRARHEGIPVIGDPTPPTPEPRKPRAIMPVPKPLEAAVERGHFGESEDGPINPSPDEVRAITLNLAEKLIDWMTGMREVEKMLHQPVCADRSRLYREKDMLAGHIGSGLAMYAEDFGPQAAAQLRAYSSHQAGKQQRER